MSKALRSNKVTINGSSNQILWDGPNIPCIDLCTGDTVSSIVYKIASHICSIYTDIDALKNLTFQCLVDCSNTTPKDYSLKGIFEVLLTNDCKLQEAIDAVAAQSAAGSVVIGALDLSCLETRLIQLCVDPKSYTLNDLLQCFINIMCDHETRIVDIIVRIQALEELVKSLHNAAVAGIYIEPTFSSCVNVDGTGTPIPTIHSALTPILANFACSLRTDLGTATDVASSISQQCISDYLTNSSIILNPNNLAEDNHNKWIVICDMLTRVKFMEDNCCAPSCDDIFIGFSTVYDSGSQQVTLTFSNAAGTKIPVGFTDTGSTITFTDSSNNTMTLPIMLSNGLVWTSPALSIDFTQPVTVKITSNLTNGVNGLKCIDCYNQVIPAQDVTCSVCKICATGGDTGDQISITYSTPSNPVATTVVLEKGACLSFELPSDKPVISNVSILTPGSSIYLDLSSECNGSITLPTAVLPSCWFFEVPVDYSVVGMQGFHNTSVTSVLLSACLPETYYHSLTTSLGTSLINGPTVTVVPWTGGGGLGEFAKLPNALPPHVGTKSLCGGYYSIEDVSSGIGCLSGHTTQVDGQIGFWLQISGQLPGDIPEIEIRTQQGTKIYIKGTPNNCTC